MSFSYEELLTEEKTLYSDLQCLEKKLPSWQHVVDVPSATKQVKYQGKNEVLVPKEVTEFEVKKLRMYLTPIYTIILGGPERGPATRRLDQRRKSDKQCWLSFGLGLKLEVLNFPYDSYIVLSISGSGWFHS